MSIRLKGRQYQADIMIKGTRFRKSFPNSYDAEMWEDELRRRKALGLDIGELVNEEPMITLEEAMEKPTTNIGRTQTVHMATVRRCERLIVSFLVTLYCVM